MLLPVETATPPIDLEWLAQRESGQVEWKEGVADWQNVVGTLVAFANDFHNLGGGHVVCGAREARDEHGFPRMERPGLTASRIAEVTGRVTTALREHVTPPIAPLVSELDADTPDRRVLVLTVARTGQAHSWRDKAGGATGRYLIRIGNETREARNGLLTQLLAKRGTIPPWDLRVKEGASVDDLDLLRLREALKRMGVYRESRGVDPYLQPDTRVAALAPALCSAVPLTGRAVPRNFALLLFGRDPQSWCGGAHVVFSVYRGTDRSEQTAERYSLTGTVIEQADELVRRLELASPDVFDKGGPRENLTRFPRRALKELAVNALAHRDYESEQPVRVTVFKDRVEIVSPGGLPDAVPEDDFLAGRATAHWRNQSLAWFFNQLDLAQSEGQGIATVLRLVPEAGYPPPEFHLTDHAVKVVLHAHPAADKVVELDEVEDALLRGDQPGFASHMERLVKERPADPVVWSLLLDGLETDASAPLQKLLWRLVASQGPKMPAPDIAARVVMALHPRSLAPLDFPGAKEIVRSWSRQLAESAPPEAVAIDFAHHLLRQNEPKAALAVLGRLDADDDWWFHAVSALVHSALRSSYRETAEGSGSRRVRERAEARAREEGEAVEHHWTRTMDLIPDEERRRLPDGFDLLLEL